MTDADSFYDKLLASIGLPSDEPEPLPNSNRKESSQDYKRNGNGRNGDEREREAPRRPTEPQPELQLQSPPKSKSQPQPSLPKPKPELPHQNLKPEPAPEPRLEPRPTPSTVPTLPPKPIPSSTDLRDRIQSLTKQLSTSSPSAPPVTALKSPSEIPSSTAPLPDKPQAKEEPRKNPATLEAELRRKLLENGLRKRKSSPPEGGVTKTDGTDKRRKITPPPLPTPPPPPPVSVTPDSVETKEKDSAAEAEAIKSRQAELRRKLLERSNLIKQKPPPLQANGDAPTHNFDSPRKINRSYSPIEISSDDDEPSSTSKTISTLPPFLPPRPPPREGFKLRISVPFPAAPGKTIVLKTEKLSLSTPISSILELFGTARDGDHLYFPGSNPKPTSEIESGEKADLVLGEEGQRFYRDDDETGREASKVQEAATRSPKIVVKKEEGWHSQSRGSSLVGGSSLRGDAMDYVPGSRLKEAETAGPQWTGLIATLEDIWTRGKKVVDCTLVRAGDGEDEEEDQAFSEKRPPTNVEDRGNSWHPQRPHRNSHGDFATGIEHQWADEQEEGEEGEEEEADGEGWGYNEGYPEGSGPNSNMNWGPGYPMGTGQLPGSWNPEQYPMIPNTNIPDPNAQWYATQHPQYPHSGQPSPVFPQHDETQGPAFMGGGAPVLQAMHWVPGHTDYANAGWTYGYGSNDSGQAGVVGPSTEPVEETPAAVDPVNKAVLDVKPPAQGQTPQQPRTQIGGAKQKRPRGGRQVKRKERRKGGSGGSGIGRNGGGGVGAVS